MFHVKIPTEYSLPINRSQTLLPSAQSFKDSGWMPQSKDVYDQFIRDLTDKISSKLYDGPEGRLATPGGGYSLHPNRPPLLPRVQEFLDFIENDPTVFAEFHRMFEHIRENEHPNNYLELVYMFNEIFRSAPDFGSLGPPLYMIMANIMNSQGGFSAFTKENLNRHFKKMFETWSDFLLSEDSRTVLNNENKGWLCEAALLKMVKGFPDRTFAQVFICDPNDPHYGFRSFEDFFNRRLRDPAVDRPTGDINDLRIISAACESTTYAYQENVLRQDPLFIKDQAYSLVHLLADNYVDVFEGGTILQSFLSTTSYHRWHAPVKGTIKKIVDVPGTYFAQGPHTLGLPTNNDELPPYLQSLRFFANTAARQLIFIDAKNEKLGLMCFIAIGMTEISSCEATVCEGQEVERGDQLGMFHFGGSSSALVFRKDAGVQVDGEYRVPKAALKVNRAIAIVQ
ncbi:hypothetical protein AAF712_015130 [Marasmius tenuissimus]|uniref:L-tryptophan decarboxylase PsiD-like domain-containing protein n=1 Tax=Marasmius tenuissimus TaxID=585030 RepID=A0ABR2ZB89_9AGAR